MLPIMVPIHTMDKDICFQTGQKTPNNLVLSELFLKRIEHHLYKTARLRCPRLYIEY